MSERGIRLARGGSLGELDKRESKGGEKEETEYSKGRECPQIRAKSSKHEDRTGGSRNDYVHTRKLERVKRRGIENAAQGGWQDEVNMPRRGADGEHK